MDQGIQVGYSCIENVDILVCSFTDLLVQVSHTFLVNLIPPTSHAISFNENILRVGIIESLAGLHAIDKFLELDLLDVYYFGAYDLSLALGKPGEPYDSSVLSHIQICIDKVNSANRFAGGFVPQSFVEVQKLLDMGIKFITYNVDSSILYSNVLSLVDHISGL